MKKRIIAIVTALTLTAGALSGVAYAHKSKSPERAVERMTERLNLSEEQQGQIKELYEQRMQEHKSMKENMTAEQRKEMYKSGGREAMKAQMESQIKALLNADQVALFDQMHADKDHKDGHHKGEHGKYGHDKYGHGKYGHGESGHHGEEREGHDEEHDDHMDVEHSERHHS